jgi:hypothetical protein
MHISPMPRQFATQFYNTNGSPSIARVQDQYGTNQYVYNSLRHFPPIPQTQAPFPAPIAPMQAQPQQFYNPQIQRQSNSVNDFAGMAPQELQQLYHHQAQQLGLEASLQFQHQSNAHQQHINALELPRQRAFSQRSANQNTPPAITSSFTAPESGQKRQLSDVGGPPSKRAMTQSPATGGHLPSNHLMLQMQQSRRIPQTPAPMNGTPHHPAAFQNMQNVQYAHHSQMVVHPQGGPNGYLQMQSSQHQQQTQAQIDHATKAAHVNARAHQLVLKQRRMNNESTDTNQYPILPDEISLVKPILYAELLRHQKAQQEQQRQLSTQQSQHVVQNGNNLMVHGSAHEGNPVSKEGFRVVERQQELRQQQMLSQQTHQQMPLQQQIQQIQIQQQQIQQQQQMQQSFANGHVLSPTLPVMAEMGHQTQNMQQVQEGEQAQGLDLEADDVAGSWEELVKVYESSNSPEIQQSIENPPLVNEMSVEQQILNVVELEIQPEVQQPASNPMSQHGASSSNHDISSQNLDLDTSSPAEDQAVASTAAVHAPMLEVTIQDQELPLSSQSTSTAHYDLNTQQSSVLNEQSDTNSLISPVSTADSGELCKKQPLPGSTPSNKPAAIVGEGQQMATPPPSRSETEPISSPTEAISKPTITSEGQGVVGKNLQSAFTHPDVAASIKKDGVQDKDLLQEFYAIGKDSQTTARKEKPMEERMAEDAAIDFPNIWKNIHFDLVGENLEIEQGGEEVPTNFLELDARGFWILPQ